MACELHGAHLRRLLRIPCVALRRLHLPSAHRHLGHTAAAPPLPPPLPAQQQQCSVAQHIEIE